MSHQFKNGLPAFIADISHSLATQDNRITDMPLFAVQEKKVIWGVDPEYHSCDLHWVRSEDGKEATPQDFRRMEKLYQDTGRISDKWRRVYATDQWEFVTACFTEQGCKDYIKANGHNHKELRIYAYGTYRNAEYRQLLTWLRSPVVAPSLYQRAIEALNSVISRFRHGSAS